MLNNDIHRITLKEIEAKMKQLRIDKNTSEEVLLEAIAKYFRELSRLLSLGDAAAIEAAKSPESALVPELDPNLLENFSKIVGPMLSKESSISFMAAVYHLLMQQHPLLSRVCYYDLRTYLNDKRIGYLNLGRGFLEFLTIHNDSIDPFDRHTRAFFQICVCDSVAISMTTYFLKDVLWKYRNNDDALCDILKKHAKLIMLLGDRSVENGDRYFNGTTMGAMLWWFFSLYPSPDRESKASRLFLDLYTAIPEFSAKDAISANRTPGASPRLMDLADIVKGYPSPDKAAGGKDSVYSKQAYMDFCTAISLAERKELTMRISLQSKAPTMHMNTYIPFECDLLAQNKHAPDPALVLKEAVLNSPILVTIREHRTQMQRNISPNLKEILGVLSKISFSDEIFWKYYADVVEKAASSIAFFNDTSWDAIKLQNSLVRSIWLKRRIDKYIRGEDNSFQTSDAQYDFVEILCFLKNCNDLDVCGLFSRNDSLKAIYKKGLPALFYQLPWSFIQTLPYAELKGKWAANYLLKAGASSAVRTGEEDTEHETALWNYIKSMDFSSYSAHEQKELNEGLIKRLNCKEAKNLTLDDLMLLKKTSANLQKLNQTHLLETLFDWEKLTTQFHCFGQDPLNLLAYINELPLSAEKRNELVAKAIAQGKQHFRGAKQQCFLVMPSTECPEQLLADCEKNNMLSEMTELLSSAKLIESREHLDSIFRTIRSRNGMAAWYDKASGQVVFNVDTIENLFEIFCLKRARSPENFSKLFPKFLPLLPGLIAKMDLSHDVLYNLLALVSEVMTPANYDQLFATLQASQCDILQLMQSENRLLSIGLGMGQLTRNPPERAYARGKELSGRTALYNAMPHKRIIELKDKKGTVEALILFTPLRFKKRWQEDRMLCGMVGLLAAQLDRQTPKIMGAVRDCNDELRANVEDSVEALKDIMQRFSTSWTNFTNDPKGQKLEQEDILSEFEQIQMHIANLTAPPQCAEILNQYVSTMQRVLRVTKEQVYFRAQCNDERLQGLIRPAEEPIKPSTQAASSSDASASHIGGAAVLTPLHAQQPQEARHSSNRRVDPTAMNSTQLGFRGLYVRHNTNSTASNTPPTSSLSLGALDKDNAVKIESVASGQGKPLLLNNEDIIGNAYYCFPVTLSFQTISGAIKSRAATVRIYESGEITCIERNSEDLNVQVVAVIKENLSLVLKTFGIVPREASNLFGIVHEADKNNQNTEKRTM